MIVVSSFIEQGKVNKHSKMFLLSRWSSKVGHWQERLLPRFGCHSGFFSVFVSFRKRIFLLQFFAETDTKIRGRLFSFRKNLYSGVFSRLGSKNFEVPSMFSFLQSPVLTRRTFEHKRPESIQKSISAQMIQLMGWGLEFDDVRLFRERYYKISRLLGLEVWHGEDEVVLSRVT